MFRNLRFLSLLAKKNLNTRPNLEFFYFKQAPLRTHKYQWSKRKVAVYLIQTRILAYAT